jgi:hypothetical protein
MGSVISLDIDDFNLEWAKNDAFQSHSCLFVPGDARTVAYHYADNIIEEKEAYARPLRQVVPRLELLGYSLESIRKTHIRYAEEHLDTDDPTATFERISQALSRVDLDQASAYETSPEEWPLPSPLLTLLRCASLDGDGVATDALLLEYVQPFDPYAILRLLAENPANAERLVIWRIADVVSGGWAIREALVPQPQRRYLIITEGSSDSAILQKALEILQSDVADFFYFVDMHENYPFTGSGNLFNFVQGLAKIGVGNLIVALFDNDQVGSNDYNRTMQLRLPSNIGPMKLPDVEEFERFLTVGPTGAHQASINGTGAAIECYLDLHYGSAEEPVVRWHSYDSRSGRYQGVLENKTAYAKRFLQLRHPDSGYDFSKLIRLLDALLERCKKVF